MTLAICITVGNSFITISRISRRATASRRRSAGRRFLETNPYSFEPGAPDIREIGC